MSTNTPIDVVTFESLTPEQKRVAVARDVIARIDADKIDVRQGMYLELFLDIEEEGTDDLRDLLSRVKQRAQCRVCALGGLLVSYVGFVDRVKVAREYDEDRPHETNVHADSGTVYDPVTDDPIDVPIVGSCRPNHILVDIFSVKQLDMIEIAFEMDTHIVGDSWTPLVHRRAAKMYGRHLNETAVWPSDRLKAIMQNIIDNNGAFVVPESFYEEARRYLGGRGDEAGA